MGNLRTSLRVVQQFIGSVKGRKCSPVVIHLLEELCSNERENLCPRVLEYYLQFHPDPTDVCSSSPLNRTHVFNVVTLKFHEVSLRVPITWLYTG